MSEVSSNAEIVSFRARILSLDANDCGLDSPEVEPERFELEDVQSLFSESKSVSPDNDSSNLDQSREPEHVSVCEQVIDQVLSDCQSCLRGAVYAELRRLQCNREADAVVLVGVVSTFHKKQLAQESIRMVPGLGRIINQVEVSPEHFSNQWVTAPR